VKLSVKSDYAARAVLGLARHYPSGRAVRVEQLGQEQRVPPKFLIQILLELKGAGLVRSVRGKEGGYLLARAPAEVTLRDVIRAVHGSVFDSPALEDDQCPPELKQAWSVLQETMDREAAAIRFQDLLEAAEGKDKMYYI